MCDAATHFDHGLSGSPVDTLIDLIAECRKRCEMPISLDLDALADLCITAPLVQTASAFTLKLQANLGTV
jgi:hypothetical protein